MHRCLQIPEIVLNVVSQVAPEQKKTLLSFALVCHAFQTAALDELWKGPDDGLFEHLLGCFLSDLFEITVAPDKVTARLHRPVTRRDWDRPSLYCARVRHVTLEFQEAAKYANLLGLISISFYGEFLFPRLESLRWDMGNPAAKKRDTDLVGFLRLLVPPTLKTIHLEKPYGALRLMLSILPTISARVRSLTDVHLGSGSSSGCSTNERAAISDFVVCFDGLRSLSVPSVDSRAWLHLAQLPELKSFTLETCLDAVPALPRDAEKPFAQLTHLSIGVVTVPAALRILLLVGNAPVEYLCITPAFMTTAGQLTTFYAALADTTNLKNTLKSLNQELPRRPPDTTDDDGWGVPRAALVSIGAFSKLTTISMQSFRHFEIDEVTLLGLARGWPNLKSLRLAQNTRESTLPLNALIGLASLCPHLMDISLTFDTTTIPSLRATGARGERRATLDVLNELTMGHSNVEATQIFEMARFISGLCPVLEYLFSDNTQPDGVYTRWTQVEELVLKLHQVREEETEWAHADDDDDMGDEEAENGAENLGQDNP
uniref:F-box domain-containing protein n=1 Tax=Mycena chlorophos TaxID=658473 RepID=A0ABQ0LW04_MYCCL|nr:predicted protein [Mycena chlorophos]